ncbi:hypothetical protein [Streptomyces sp. DSM 15324]|uniref:hypothetical protein n=1 Tax=Streptomyces sp. DSM 15324 TaxID=1739111 RepID=UPI000746E5E4|nr:hypothetical protein [Streptomyces sp. DSM 15324]KUO08028.1 hypothetical protein AQJ58_32215 [Streptomyces sp. DSM 15324]
MVLRRPDELPVGAHLLNGEGAEQVGGRRVSVRDGPVDGDRGVAGGGVHRTLLDGEGRQLRPGLPLLLRGLHGAGRQRTDPRELAMT